METENIYNNKLIKVIFNCGVITKKQIKQSLELEEDLLIEIKKHLLESKTVIFDKKEIVIYYFSDNGLNKVINYYMSNKLPITYYNNWLPLYQKNIKLTELYLKLSTKKYFKWINQQEIAKATSSEFLFDAMYCNENNENIGIKFIKKSTTNTSLMLEGLNKTLIDLEGKNMELFLY